MNSVHSDDGQVVWTSLAVVHSIIHLEKLVRRADDRSTKELIVSVFDLVNVLRCWTSRGAA